MRFSTHVAIDLALAVSKLPGFAHGVSAPAGRVELLSPSLGGVRKRGYRCCTVSDRGVVAESERDPEPLRQFSRARDCLTDRGARLNGPQEVDRGENMALLSHTSPRVSGPVSAGCRTTATGPAESRRRGSGRGNKIGQAAQIRDLRQPLQEPLFPRASPTVLF